MPQVMPRPLELLAPARDADTAIQAVLHGADAVYIGGPSHGARAAVGNSLDDIRRAVDFAHGYDARIYVTLNTLIYDDELSAVRRLVEEYWRMGVDALIVQDLGLLCLDLPPIALHASTQCDIRTPRKARMLQDAGMSQLVLPREMSLEEIRRVRAEVDVPLEAFVHGALCVCYSGDCQASLLTTGRSANRGECSQVCRWNFDLIDGSGRKVVAGRHLLSLRDMNRLDRLADMADAGVSSFKIEGRLKDQGYVKTVVTAYRRALDRLIEGSEGRYCRSSEGFVVTDIPADTSAVFNRGFTDYFLDGRPGPEARMASHATPKWVGRPVGRVASVGRNWFELSGSVALTNGDGLSWFDASGAFCGCRVNRVDGRRIYPAEMPSLKPGTEMFRNRDKALDDALAGATARRLIPLALELRPVEGGVALRLVAPGALRRIEATVSAQCELQDARSDQLESRRRVLAKLGGTRWQLSSLSDLLGDKFIAASVLADLRRRGIQALETAMQLSRKPDLRRPSCLAPDALAGLQTTYHDNIANSAATQFYTSHGAEVASQALEVAPAKGPIRVMTTRYCLRRELGACLRTPTGAALPEPLKLISHNHEFLLHFDCTTCRMHLTTK